MLKMLRLMENNFPTALDEGAKWHCDVLEQLISLGIGLQQTAVAKGVVLSKKEHGTTAEELTATVDWLRDKRAMWHGDVTPKRKAAILEAIFGNAAA